MKTDPAAAEDPSQPASTTGTGTPSARARGKKGKGTGKTRKDGTPKAPKATNAEIAQRVSEVLKLKLDGAQFHDIEQYSSQMGWNVGERQIREYMGRADDLLRERQERKRSRLIAYHRATRRALYARALQAADYRTALACLSDEAKLIGLYPKDKAGTADGKPDAVPLVTITTDDDDTPPAAD